MDEQRFLKQVGVRIREARTKAGLKQKDLAEHIGKTQDAISSYETGTRAMRITELPAIAQALDVPVAYLLGDDFRDEEIMAVVRQLTPPFRTGLLIEARKSLELQSTLFSIFGEIDEEKLGAANEFVKKFGPEYAQEAQEELSEEIMRLYRQTRDSE